MTTGQLELLRHDGLQNLRDCGGLPLPTGGETRHGRLLRSDSPHRLTKAGCARLLEAGVRTVVDLRTSSERRGNPSVIADVTAIRSVHAPIFEDDDAFPSELVTNVDVYCWWAEQRAHAVATALAAIADSDGAPVLVHCHAGKDRTGLVVALVLRAAGVAVDVVADEYALSGVMLAEVLKADRQRHLDRRDVTEAQLDRWFSVRRETMLETLSRIEERLGSPMQVLGALGLDGPQVTRLRILLTADAWPPTG